MKTIDLTKLKAYIGKVELKPFYEYNYTTDYKALEFAARIDAVCVDYCKGVQINHPAGLVGAIADIMAEAKTFGLYDAVDDILQTVALNKMRKALTVTIDEEVSRSILDGSH